MEERNHEEESYDCCMCFFSCFGGLSIEIYANARAHASSSTNLDLNSNPNPNPNQDSDSPYPTVAPPSVPLDFLTDVHVLKADGFANLSNWNTWNSGTGHVSDDLFVLTGQKGWASGLVYKEKIHEGYGVVLRYKTTKNSDFQSEFVFATGEWQTASWRQFGVYNGSRPKADLFQGKEGLGFKNLGGNLSLKADTWYDLLMAVAQDGDLLAVVWNPDNPSKQIVYHETIGDKWAGLNWEFQAKANIGETVYVDDFLLLAFTAFK